MFMQSSNSTPPWWTFGHLWLVIAGPVVVVIASFVTFYLAYSDRDVVEESYYQKGLSIDKQFEGASPSSLAPAMQGRNHAQTGVPAPKEKP